ncbi:MAG: diadenylate cyclase CdaA [Candidatus Firestonebacteria bacterium]
METAISVINAFRGIRLVDFIDISILYIVFYYLIVFFRETRTMQMLKGLGIMLFLTFVAKILDIRTTTWIINNLYLILGFTLIVLFAPELRQIFVDLGQRRIRIRAFFNSDDEIYNSIVDACRQMLKKKMGCIIVLEREVGLKEYIDTGSRLNADISAPLLLTIFFPKTLLHDGAVIISHGRIAAAGCVLPLSEKNDIDVELGMRHRAALGLTEICDAIAVVVSEDLRNISLSVNGKITPGIEPKNLKEMLMMYAKKN